jgi:acetyltransferase-like isoleucine patch superfamily enzyme
VPIGEGTCIYRDVVISSGNEPIRIGKNCVLTGCAILAHDASTNRALGIKYGDPSITCLVNIEDDCFIGYGSIILMGVTIGRGSIIGAGAVVTKDVAPGSVMGGNPARVINTTSALVEKRKQQILKQPKMF